MELQVDMVRCNRCGKVREKFLVGCPQCGTVENTEFDPNKKEEVQYVITPEVIKAGAEFFKKELEDIQKAWFKNKIPSGQSWQFYAGIVLAARLSLIWLKDVLPFEAYSQPISCTNARVYYVMSFMSQQKQKLFCDFLNMTNREKKNGKDNIQGEIDKSDVGTNSST